MKNNHQNVRQRIRNNEVNSYNYLTNNSSLNYNLSSVPAVFWTNKLTKSTSKQMDLLLRDDVKTNKELIIEKIGAKAYDYVEHFAATESHKTQLLFSTKDQITKEGFYQDMVCLQSFNSIAKLDSFLIRVNESLEDNGKFIGFVQTNKQRKENQWVRKVPFVGKISAIGEFAFHRICPKVKGLKQLYFGITRGKHQRLSKAEVLGRLIKFGFKITELEEDIDGVMYFVVKKVKEPDVKSKSSNGFIYKFPRVGQNGKIIGVYKIRTMHPYSEYLQDYVVNTNGYGSNGKPANDFRVPSWARFVRRYWLDELPQLVNVLKGDMKLFGVRPVTDRYFQDIPKHIQKLRLSQKPGCIPPYIAYNRVSSKESVLMAEEDYLLSSKKGRLVDFKFIVMAVKNIVFNKKRGA
ncbi:MAG: lipopolysaccharide/colanic/teichoic acid biosynthesis glycosyltransferase [Salibacteraceae bacterium]|jgi:lipopolysaccharide/colanic/teichoic acid biosynthesis glycosyltransferase